MEEKKKLLKQDYLLIDKFCRASVQIQRRLAEKNFPAVNKERNYDVAKLVVDQVYQFYKKTKILTISSKAAVEKILVFYYRDYQGCFRIPISRRAGHHKSIEFQTNLDKTMPFLANAEEIMRTSMKKKSKVKLCSDFINLSKKEYQMQNNLQVVENRRNFRPNQ